jgi:hypothetical protein
MEIKLSLANLDIRRKTAPTLVGGSAAAYGAKRWLDLQEIGRFVGARSLGNQAIQGGYTVDLECYAKG